jgi:SOS-response transcriptional repressor LexA
MPLLRLPDERQRLMPRSQSKPASESRQRRYDRLAVLDYIDTYIRTHGYSPSQRIIYRDLQMSAPSVAHNALHALERQGLLTIKTIQPGWPAVLEVTALGGERLRAWRADREAAPGEASQ